MKKSLKLGFLNIITPKLNFSCCRLRKKFRLQIERKPNCLITDIRREIVRTWKQNLNKFRLLMYIPKPLKNQELQDL